MLAALIIVFREVVEAGLIVGIVLAATEGVAHRRRWIATGVAAGLLGAAIVAAFAQRLSEAFSGTGQELFNAAILIAATVMLGWHNVWMARHGRELSREMKALGRRRPRAGRIPVYLHRRARRGRRVSLPARLGPRALRQARLQHPRLSLPPGPLPPLRDGPDEVGLKKMVSDTFFCPAGKGV